jgi:hypothetical protein
MEMERLPLCQSIADRHRAAELKWRGMPPGIPPDMAIDFMSKLKAGSTIRQLTGGGTLGPALVSYDRFKKHCDLNPQWASEALRISRLSTRALKIARFRAMTHCKNGHPLANASFYQKEGYVARHCKTCRLMRAKQPSIIKPEIAEKVRALLKANVSISSITKAGTRSYVMNHVTFTHFRKQDPEIDALAARIIAGAQPRAQKLRWSRARNRSAREHNNDYYGIRALLPAAFPDKDDVVANIFEALLNGSLRREDVGARVKQFITDHNRMFPTNFAKFGDARLVSLDEVMFEDGSTTRGDNVSRGLWD